MVNTEIKKVNQSLVKSLNMAFQSNDNFYDLMSGDSGEYCIQFGEKKNHGYEIDVEFDIDKNRYFHNESVIVLKEITFRHFRDPLLIKGNDFDELVPVHSNIEKRIQTKCETVLIQSGELEEYLRS